MQTSNERPPALPRDTVGPEDYDASGRYLYPGDVEEAMPEAWLAWWLGVYLVQAIERLVADPERDSVCANMPIYYAEGEPSRLVAPDVFFLAGVPFDEERRSYCLWKTGVPPAVVFEIVSRGHEKKDLVANRALYEQLGVSEYYWFDPRRRLVSALRLATSGRYEPAVPDEAGRWPSPALGLEVGLHEGRLGLFERGRYVEPERAHNDALRRELAEAEQKIDEQARALEQERRAREQERREREEERRAREQVEQELRAAREELRRLRERGDQG